MPPAEKTPPGTVIEENGRLLVYEDPPGRWVPYGGEENAPLTTVDPEDL